MNKMSNRLMFDMNNSRKNEKKKSKPSLGLVIIGIYFLLSMASVADPGVLVAIIAIAVILLIIFLYFKAGKKKIKQSNTVFQNKQDDMCKTCSDEFVYNNRQAEYNEYSVEENFVRDRQRRLKQLDDFLKNGLIDRNEYMVLRSHYDK